MQPESKFILVSHDGGRKEDFLVKAGLNWESIETHKVYKRTFEIESELIREEFVSREVLDKIEDLKRVEVDYGEVEDEMPAQPIIKPYEEMPEFIPKKKKPPVLNPLGGTQPDVACHYIYICTKKVEIKEPEQEEVVEEEEKPKKKFYYN
jgi:hypothetical protein